MSYQEEQKINGTTYVYEATASWDKANQHSQSKRIYIGKKDPVTGEFQPNKHYYEWFV